MCKEFDNTILQIDGTLKRTLQFIPDDIKQRCEEIRLRAGLPVCLTVDGEVMFVCQNSSVLRQVSLNCLISSQENIEKTLSLLCNNSVYLHENEIKQGYISLPSGSRAGVCGVFNAEGMLTRISSINLRVARQIFGCAQTLLPYVVGGLLIAGPPGCGKTTMLRDLIRLLSNGKSGRYCRVAAIDSRGEISGGGTLDLGVNTDILCTKNKAVGTEIALRTMFPNVIAFDEVGTQSELSSISNCFNAGVDIVTTAHCCNENDLMSRDIVRKMVQIGIVKWVAVLSQNIGDPPLIFNVKELTKGVYC